MNSCPCHPVAAGLRNRNRKKKKSLWNSARLSGCGPPTLSFPSFHLFGKWPNLRPWWPPAADGAGEKTPTARAAISPDSGQSSSLGAMISPFHLMLSLQNGMLSVSEMMPHHRGWRYWIVIRSLPLAWTRICEAMWGRGSPSLAHSGWGMERSVNGVQAGPCVGPRGQSCHSTCSCCVL